MVITITSNYDSGDPVWFADLPAGTYTIKYVQGALDYDGSGYYHVNYHPFSEYLIVYEDTPWTSLDSAPGNDTGYTSQALVEAGNAGLTVTVTHPGGRLGIVLNDPGAYGDNTIEISAPQFSVDTGMDTNWPPPSPNTDYQDYAQSLGPVLYYQFDEKPTVATDYSGNNYDGIDNLPLQQMIPGLITQNANNAYIFKGGYVEIPWLTSSKLIALTDYTICWWAIWNGPSGQSNQRFFDFGDTNYGEATGKYNYATPEHHDVGRFVWRHSLTGASGENTFNLVGPELQVGEKYFFTLMQDGAYKRMYVNGQLYTSTNAVPITLADINIKKAFIGKSQWPIDPAFNGVIDEFKIYSRVLSADEIKHLYDLGIAYTAPSDGLEQSLYQILILSDDYNKNQDYNIIASDALTLGSFRGSQSTLSGNITLTDSLGLHDRLLNVTPSDLYLIDKGEALLFKLHETDSVATDILKINQNVGMEHTYLFHDILPVIDSFDTPHLKFDTLYTPLILTDSFVLYIPKHEFVSDSLIIIDSSVYGSTLNIKTGDHLFLADADSPKSEPIHVNFLDHLVITDGLTDKDIVNHQQIVSTIIFSDSGHLNLSRIAYTDTLTISDSLHVNLSEFIINDPLVLIDNSIVQLNHAYLIDTINIFDSVRSDYGVINLKFIDPIILSDAVQIGIHDYHAFLSDTLTLADLAFRVQLAILTDTLIITDLIERFKYSTANNVLSILDTVVDDLRHGINDNLIITDRICLFFNISRNLFDELTITDSTGLLTPAPADGTGDTEFDIVYQKYVDDFLLLVDEGILQGNTQDCVMSGSW